MSDDRKPILCLDFDGVVHWYRKGWQDGTIYDSATPGFFRWAVQAMEHFRLVIYSSRSSDPEGLRRMNEWLGTQSIEAIKRGEVPADFDWGGFFPNIEFADKKPPAFLTIDDRAITFQGDWGQLNPIVLRGFKPWTENAPFKTAPITPF